MTTIKNLKSAKRGFSLMELMLVIVIMAVMGSFAVPRFMDTQKMNESREEAQKLSELKAKITSMFDMDSDFSDLAAMLPNIAPSTYERADGALKSIWKQKVTAAGKVGEYTITFAKVPANAVCQEFVKNTRRQLWNSIKVGDGDKGGAITAESKPVAIVNACAEETATAVKTITFKYAP